MAQSDRSSPLVAATTERRAAASRKPAAKKSSSAKPAPAKTSAKRSAAAKTARSSASPRCDYDSSPAGIRISKMLAEIRAESRELEEQVRLLLERFG
jgi:hypothetical protein